MTLNPSSFVIIFKILLNNIANTYIFSFTTAQQYNVKEENAAFIQWETGQSNCTPLEKKIVTGTAFIYQVFKMASKVDYLSSLNTTDRPQDKTA